MNLNYIATSPTIISRYRSTPHPKNSSSDCIQDIPNMITKARSLSSYIENTPIINSTTSTASTSIVRTTSNTIMPSIDHDTST